MFASTKVYFLFALVLAYTNGFHFNGRTNFNIKSSLQMNDVRKTENKRDKSLAGILGYTMKSIWTKLMCFNVLPASVTFDFSTIICRIRWIYQKDVTSSNPSNGWSINPDDQCHRERCGRQKSNVYLSFPYFQYYRDNYFHGDRWRWAQSTDSHRYF